MADLIKVVVKTREKVVYDGEVKSLSSKNKKGVFDILPQHANFISLIDEVLVIREADGRKKEIPVSNAILRVHKNQVEVYLGVEKVLKSSQYGQKENLSSPKD